MNFNKRLYFVVCVVVIVLIMVSAFLFKEKTGYVVINDKKIKVEIVDSESEREDGLMRRESLDSDSGMLFIFPDSEIRSFWMKNMLIPLDMIFIDENFEIVNIKQNVSQCFSESCPNYVSSKPVKYVLEVNSGFSERNNVSIGTSVLWT